jgi:signal transduction histidine kinase/ligand-binding sensor domain-containing protein
MRLPAATLKQGGPLQPEAYHSGSGASDSVECIHLSPDGSLWVGTMAGLFRWERGHFSTIIPDLPIERIEQAAGGHLLIITQKGFVEWDGIRIVEHPEMLARLGLGAKRIHHVIEDRTGVRWFCTGAGVARQSGSSVQPFRIDGLGSSPEAYHAYEDSRGTIWIAHAGGLLRATAAGLETFEASLQVKSLYNDRDGQLWFGTNGQGVVRYKDRLVRMFTTADGLPSNVTMTVLSGSDGKLWVGSNCGGLSWFDGHRFHTLAEKDGLSNTCVFTLAEGPDKSIWAGTYGGGVFRLRNGRFTQFSRPEGLKSDVVRALLQARDKSLWIATNDGLGRFQDERIRMYGTAEGLANPRVVDVYQDRKGVIWAGTTRALHRLDGDRFVALPSARGIVRVLGEDRAGHLYAWVGLDGIFRVEPDRVALVTENDFTMFSMLVDGPNTWFTSKNILRASAGSLALWEQEPNENRDLGHFDSADGFAAQSSDISANQAVTPDGRHWFATLQGVAMIDVPKLPPNAGKPALYMEEITVGKTPRPPAHELVLAPGTHHVELRFDAIELRSPEKIRFQYRLDGVNDEWLDAGATPVAIYTDFAVGTHQFHVRACNRDGIWDRSGITYAITLQPYYYQTRLFQFAVAGAIALLLAAAYQYRLRQLAARLNARLDERVAERTRMARDLHDTLLQTIQASQMMAFATLRDPANPPTTSTALNTIHDWLARAMLEARASLDALRVSGTEDLAGALRSAGQEETAGGSMKFQLSVEGAVQDTHPIVREELYLIGREAIRNACKHSHGTTVELQLAYGRDLIMRINDDGRGMEADLASRGKAGHFGLRGMRERVAHVGGTLRMTTSPDHGTRVEVMIPGRCAFRRKRLFSLLRPSKE